MLKKHPLPALIAGIFALSLCAGAYADNGVEDSSHNDGEDSHHTSGVCDPSNDHADSNSNHDGGETDHIGEHAANDIDVDHVATSVGGNVTRTPDGDYEVTLNDGSVVAVRPQGNTRVHTLATGVANTWVDTNGYVHVETADGYEMTVDSAAHNATETRNLLAQNGLSNVTTCGNRVSATHQDGSLVSMEPDYEVGHGQASGHGQYHETSTGAHVEHADGTRQGYHGVSPDINQLRTGAQSLGYVATLNSDGSLNASGNGATYRVKLSPTLTQGSSAQPGLRLSNGKVIMQYQNGREQEIVVVQ